MQAHASSKHKGTINRSKAGLCGVTPYSDAPVVISSRHHLQSKLTISIVRIESVPLLQKKKSYTEDAIQQRTEAKKLARVVNIQRYCEFERCLQRVRTVCKLCNELGRMLGWPARV